MVQKDIRNLRQALKFFEFAYNSLNKAWDNVEENRDIQNILSNNYPFEYSFDEYNVKKWIDGARQELKNIEVK